MSEILLLGKGVLLLGSLGGGLMALNCEILISLGGKKLPNAVPCVLGVSMLQRWHATLLLGGCQKAATCFEVVP